MACDLFCSLERCIHSRANIDSHLMTFIFGLFFHTWNLCVENLCLTESEQSARISLMITGLLSGLHHRGKISNMWSKLHEHDA